ncbi:MAG: radical SAM protein [bacterium]
MAKVALVSLYDEYCLGVRALAAWLNQKGHPTIVINFKRFARVKKTEITDSIGDGYMTGISATEEYYVAYPAPISENEESLLVGLIRDFGADLIGLSVPSYYKPVAVSLTKMLRERCSLPVMWGGVHPTVDSEDCLPEADLICCGEGELPVLRLLEHLDAGHPLKEARIPGLWINDKGEMHRTGRAEIVKSLDELPDLQYDPELEYCIENNRIIHKEPMLDSQLYWNFKMSTGRGCPYFCTFCIYSTIKEKYPEQQKLRRRNVDLIMRELKKVKESGHVSLVEFEDDIFTTNKKWLREFAEKYPKEIGIPFWCYVHPKFVDAEILTELKKAGIAYITMGIQSGSERITKEVFDRRSSKEECVRVASLIAEYGIPANYDIITNNPFETEEDRLATLDLLTDIPAPYNIHLVKLAFFPGSKILQLAQESNTPFTVDEKLYRFWNAMFLTACYKMHSKQAIMSMVNNRELRENPEILWENLRVLAELKDLRESH